MTSDRFHRQVPQFTLFLAARDGLLDILKEATRRDCNGKDEDGMTPTLWAAFEGNLDALRLLVGRGGDPDKADHFGNTALHFAAARGHMSCVSFLTNFGVNLWALDIDFHTAKELAAMNNRDEILRYLDSVVAAEETNNRKVAKAKRDKALKDAEKRAKELEKQHRKAEKLAEKEQKRLLKEREKMETIDNNLVATYGTMPHRPSNVIAGLKKAKQAEGTKFSEIVQPKKSAAGVQKRLQNKKVPQTNGPPVSDFKVGAGDDKRSVRSLTGLRRDSEVMYVGAYDTQTGKRGKIAGVFEQNGDLNRSTSEPDFLHNSDSGFGDEGVIQEPASIFDRPGFGTVAFRNSITATLNALPPARDQVDNSAKAQNRVRAMRARRRASQDSVASSSSSGRTRQREVPWDAEDVESDEEDDAEWSPLQLFLLSHGLGEYVQLFINEQIDLEALMLLSEDDLVSVGLPMGPRRKLLKAAEDRRAALEDPGEVEDSQL
ncbi:hypothetical protein B566_EDAN010645 [Ephemera danica]|nr:hypothetical protein B566_EDAN010645 [Ephemera danica]